MRGWAAGEMSAATTAAAAMQAPMLGKTAHRARPHGDDHRNRVAERKQQGAERQNPAFSRCQDWPRARGDGDQQDDGRWPRRSTVKAFECVAEENRRLNREPVIRRSGCWPESAGLQSENESR